MENSDAIRHDFDRLAPFAGEGWNHNNHYHPFILELVPAGCRHALDIGCGAGLLARALSGRCEKVIGIDLSPGMIAEAEKRAADHDNVSFATAEMMGWTPPARFDFIASVATLHHLPLAPALARSAGWLNPGGVFVNIDLYQQQTPADYASTLATIPASWLMKWRHPAGPASPEAQAAWQAHGARDVYLPLADIRRQSAGAMPGATVRRRLYWRYSLVWMKPG
jgi:2-polyprenyl-3-methyl-5-hydroxy-6-metoxy-1,4-benzoquinol methylase